MVLKFALSRNCHISCNNNKTNYNLILVHFDITVFYKLLEKKNLSNKKLNVYLL